MNDRSNYIDLGGTQTRTYKPATPQWRYNENFIFSFSFCVLSAHPNRTFWPLNFAVVLPVNGLFFGEVGGEHDLVRQAGDADDGSALAARVRLLVLVVSGSAALAHDLGQQWNISLVARLVAAIDGCEDFTLYRVV